METSAVPIEVAAVMDYARQGPYALQHDPPIWKEYQQRLHEAGVTSQLQRIPRFEFYEAAAQRSVVATIATGEQQVSANLLLTIGLITPEES